MAEEAVVDQDKPLYKAVGRVIQILHRTHGPLYLAMLAWLRGQPRGDWTLLVGSRPLVRDRYEGTRIVATALSNELSSEQGRRIRKIGIVAEDDPFFLALAGSIGVKPIRLVKIESCSFGGIEIERAAAFALERDVDALEAAFVTKE